jgi:hypothetical protein
MKRIIFLIVIFSLPLFSQPFDKGGVTDTVQRAVIPVIKISPVPDRNGLRYKFPCGTALLVNNKNSYPNRLFLVTAKHVIEKDKVTECIFNFSKEEDKEKHIVSISKRYSIYQNEWKHHQMDKMQINGGDTIYYTYDIAIAEIYLMRIISDNEVLWHESLNIDDFTTYNLRNYDTVSILAFPYVNEFNWDRGLTFGDLELDKGLHQFSRQRLIPFDNKKNVLDLNQIYIENPKYRPGYSGGLVYYSNAGVHRYAGVSMGMSNVVERNNKKFCLGFYITAENLKEAFFHNFK